MWRIIPSLGETPGLPPFLFSYLQNWGIYSLLLKDFSFSAPNFEETLIARIKQGVAAEATFDGVDKTIDSMVIHSKFPVADWFPGVEIGVEQWHTGINFVDLGGGDLRCLNRKIVSLRRASRDGGTDVNDIRERPYS